MYKTEKKQKSIRKLNKYFGHKTSLSNYTFIRLLGRGGFSVVYLVKHIKTGKVYAMKCIKKYKKGKDKTKQILREINVLHTLKHPNIIKIYDWFHDDKKIYIILEYIDGKDLSSFFKRELPTEDDAIYIIKQIISAIKHCHNNNVVHRDIKLGNILIDEDLNVKLTDFGLCTYKNHPNELFFDNVGTIRFTSPELLMKNGYNEKNDIWALGITIYVLLTGIYPYDGTTKKEIINNIKHEPIEFNDLPLNNAQINLLQQLLQKNPDNRPNINQISSHHWLNPSFISTPTYSRNKYSHHSYTSSYSE